VRGLKAAIAAALAAALIALCVPPALAAPLTAQQQRGRAIFFHGAPAQGPPIDAVVGMRGEPVPATALPCASCHGEDGRGRPEGGARPADIRPQVLGRAAGPGAPARPAYTPALLKRALRQGIDAAGRPLDRLMPRYRLGARNADDLLAYLRVLGSEPLPGIDGGVVRINVIGAPGLAAPPGAIYGRRIELQPGRQADAFATLDASPDGQASVEAAARDGMPTLVFSAGRSRPGPHAFAIAASQDRQASALLAHARQRGAEAVLLRDACPGPEHASGSGWVLMTSLAAVHCPLDRIPMALDRRVIVAASAPPDHGAQAIAEAQLAMLTAALARAGRDVTRPAFVAALARMHRAQGMALPPVWLMMLDLRAQRLLPELRRAGAD
jgi:hypothetical protein